MYFSDLKKSGSARTFFKVEYVYFYVRLSVQSFRTCSNFESDVQALARQIDALKMQIARIL